MPIKEAATGYQPRPHQLQLHQLLRRFNVIVCHRRFGKTVFCINQLIDRALRCKNPMPRFAYIAPTYGQAKRIAWDYLKQYTSVIPGAEANEADLRIDLLNNRARVMLLSAENPVSLKGIYLDGCILDEFGEMNPVAWREVIRPTLSDRQGWATFIGTSKGQNHFYEMREFAAAQIAQHGDQSEWFTALYKASETKIIPETELVSAKAQMTEEEYDQEYECSFTAGLVGAYFGKELGRAETEGRITKVPHDPQLPVDLYWDLGTNDLAAVWMIQSLRGRHRVIDYREWAGGDVPACVADLRNLHPRYSFGEWVLPHDAEARSFQTGRSQQETFYSLGCRPLRIIPRVGSKMESIKAARRIFGACEFDAERCKLGLKALANYRKKWDAKNNVFSEHPLHNWASNGADAFQQFALGVRERTGHTGVMDRRYQETGQHTHAEMDYNPFGGRSFE